MKPSIVNLLCASLCVFIFTMTGAALAQTPSGDLIPAGVVIKDAFAPGVGEPVGEISQVSGKVALIHLNDTQGYWAKEGTTLYKGDTIVTLADAYTALKLEDGSFMSLSPETKLEITQSVYAPEKQSRSTFMNLVTGKTRFVVKKLVEARHSEFKVKTTTSVAGVRGSDFIITATETITEVTTLENTELEVVSLAAPDAKPAILRDFEMTAVKKGALPEEVRKVSAQDVDRMMKEFKFRPTDAKTGAAAEGASMAAGAEKETVRMPPAQQRRILYGIRSSQALQGQVR